MPLAHPESKPCPSLSQGGDAPKTGWGLLLRPREEAGKGEGCWAESRQQPLTSFVVWPSHLALPRLRSSTREGQGRLTCLWTRILELSAIFVLQTESLRPEQVPEFAMCCPRRKFPEQNAEARHSPATIHGAPVLRRATVPP